MSLIAELKRRKVLRVGTAYAIVAWLVIQVASTVAPQLNLPEWAPRLITLAVLLGFPIALVLAWVFERTPEGLRIEPLAIGNKRMFTLAAILAALAVGWYFGAGLPGPGSRDGQQRLAVLPLANFSPDPDNAFFADGLHDDLLTALARLQGVDLVSRTTMQTFRGSTLTLSEIARKIGATHVVEGSVRRDDLRVRLTVQLIDASTDDHLWAETFDRPLADAMTLQSAVAQAIAGTLGVAVAGYSGAAPTTVPAAYDLYLKARLTSGEDQLRLLDSALLLDPGFTLARAARASAACYVLWFDGTRRAELMAQARADIDRARQEDAQLHEVEVAEGHYAYRCLRDYHAALAIVDRSLALNGTNVDALDLRAYLLRRLGRVDESLAAARRALELEPGNPNVVDTYVELAYFFGQFREAIQVHDAAAAKMAPGMPGLVELERRSAEFAITGELEPFLRWAASEGDNDVLTKYWFWRLSEATRERMGFWSSMREPWVMLPHAVVYPRALDVAIEADALGDSERLREALLEAGRLYDVLDPELIALPEAQTFHARFLALSGDASGAVTEVERAIAAVTPDQDCAIATNIRADAVYTLARAGARDRAIEVLASLVNSEKINGVPLFPELVFVFHDRLVRRLLGDDSRYQALMRQIETRFEPL